MQRLTKFIGLGILGLALIVGTGFSGDTKKDKDKDTKETVPQLPKGLKALKLSKDQIAKIHTIQIDYRGKITELDKKIKELKAQETATWFKVLTDDQKAQYLKGLTGDDGKDKGDKDKDKAKDKDKEKDKDK